MHNKENYPTVVMLEYYRDFKVIMYDFMKTHPDAIVKLKTHRGVTPIFVDIDGKEFMFVTYYTAECFLKGRTYYRTDGKLYHSGYPVKEVQKDEEAIKES